MARRKKTQRKVSVQALVPAWLASHLSRLAARKERSVSSVVCETLVEVYKLGRGEPK